MNVVLFANSLTHKVHQRDEYAYLSNFLFSSVLSGKNYDGSASLPFTDVADDAYYADAVVWAVAKNITSGATATTFAPNAGCTRGQMVTFLWRANGSPEPKSMTTSFTDVKSGAYYEKAVAWAVENNVTTGTSSTTFSPDASVTRAQAVTFQWRAAGAPAAERLLRPRCAVGRQRGRDHRHERHHLLPEQQLPACADRFLPLPRRQVSGHTKNTLRSNPQRIFCSAASTGRSVPVEKERKFFRPAC